MTTFAARKQERIAAGQKEYEFLVVAAWPFHGEALAKFKSHKQAEEFAFKGVGIFVGDTRANRALSAKFSKTHHVSLGQAFKIERREVQKITAVKQELS